MKQLSITPNWCEQIVENLEKLKASGDVDKAYNGNKRAITRVRVQLLEIKKMTDSARKELISVRDNLDITKP